MRILVILAHPHQNSFNHAISAKICSTLQTLKQEIIFHDLYQESFPPILEGEEVTTPKQAGSCIQQHQKELKTCDGLIIIHPNWWGQPPAILKGWIDRVIREGIGYQFLPTDLGDGIPKGLLKGKFALIFNTANTPAERERIYFGDPLELIWKNCICGFCGIEKYQRKVFSVIANSTQAQRLQWLNEVENIVRSFIK
jgi:NAD(P)H dehydrogenase (quinone)